MAKIFALQGLSNAGKSSTLIELRKQIKLKYRGQLTEQVLHRSTRRKDVKVIIDLSNGLRIGIESKGDQVAPLQKSLDDFRNGNCDLVFCACRPGGGTSPMISRRAPPDTVHFEPQQGSSVGWQAANIAKATKLMRLAKI